MMTELLKFFMDEKKEEKQRQEMRDQQFLKIIEEITTKGQDEDKRREEIRIAEARGRDERLSEERRIFAERSKKEEEKRLKQDGREKREWFKQIKARLINGDSVFAGSTENRLLWYIRH